MGNYGSGSYLLLNSILRGPLLTPRLEAVLLDVMFLGEYGGLNSVPAAQRRELARGVQQLLRHINVTNVNQQKTNEKSPSPLIFTDDKMF